MQVITHNIQMQSTNRQLKTASDRKGKAIEKLSSGYRINRSADDAAGLQISEKMRSQIRGLEKASSNIQDGISLCQVADGALSEVHALLQRMNELTVQAANGVNTVEDRQAIQDEISQLKLEINHIGTDTSFNSMSVFKPYKTNSETNEMTGVDSGMQLPSGTKMLLNAANVGTLTQNVDGSYELEDGYIYQIASDLNGKSFHIGSGKTVSIENTNLNNSGIICENAILYLDNVTIENDFNQGTTYPSGHEGAPVECVGNNEINFIGTNKLKGGRYWATQNDIFDYAAISVTTGNTVSLNGSGLLETIGGGAAAGIGGDFISGKEDAGNILIQSGEIHAYSGDVLTGAGIGGALEGKCGNIVINGGKTYSYGGDGGAGIGSGTFFYGSAAKCGLITITDGVVYASGGNTDGGAGIGGGFGSSGADVVITGGTVVAVGNEGGAGIGSGTNMSGLPLNSGTLNLTGGEVLAIGSNRTYLLTPGYGAASAIGQGALDPLMLSDVTDWQNGFQPVEIDGVSQDSFLLGRDDTTKDSNGNYTFTYKNIAGNSGTNTGETKPATETTISAGNQWWIQMGANSGEGMFLNIGPLSCKDLGLDVVQVLSESNAGASISVVQKAIQKVSAQRTKIGAQQNRLEFGKSVDDNTAENTQYAESRIRDADMAKEIVNESKEQMLEQVTQSILTEEKRNMQQILTLL
ncbi:MAG: flagellin, partial [Lachnospiraceae bacterium]